MTLDVEAILSQQIAVGLIENPCRDTLIDLASQVPADEAIVELGSFKGRSTAHLALGSHRGHGAPVHAFGPWGTGDELDAENLAASAAHLYRLSETRQTFEAHMARTSADRYVTAHQATAVAGAKTWRGPKVGLLFHDALHDYDSVFADLKAWLPKTAKDAVVVLHDTDDVRFAVNQAAEAAFTRTKTLAAKWAWDAREIHPWAQNEGKAPKDRRRGFVVVRTR